MSRQDIVWGSVIAAWAFVSLVLSVSGVARGDLLLPLLAGLVEMALGTMCMLRRPWTRLVVPVLVAASIDAPFRDVAGGPGVSWLSWALAIQADLLILLMLVGWPRLASKTAQSNEQS
jgi:hypothetical protein